MDNVTCIVVNLNDYQSGSNGSSLGINNNNNNLGPEGYRSRVASNADGNDSSIALDHSLDTQSIVGSLRSSLVVEHEASVASAGGEDEEGDSFNASAFPYQAAFSVASLKRMTSSNNYQIGNNNNNNMFHPHDIPNKQRSMGAINPRDLPGMVEPTDHFNIRGSRGSIVKAGSTNSMGSNNGSTLDSFPLSLLGSQSEKVQQHGRPVTAFDASPLSYTSGNSSGHGIASGIHGGSSLFKAPSLSGSTKFSNDSGLSQPKLAALRSMRSSNALSSSMPLSSQQSDALVVQSRMPLARPSTTLPIRTSQQGGFLLHQSF